jgi:hypothetical protein
VLLMIRLNSEHRSLMARRRVPCLDDYLDRINLVLWPRFKVGGAKCSSQLHMFVARGATIEEVHFQTTSGG